MNHDEATTFFDGLDTVDSRPPIADLIAAGRTAERRRRRRVVLSSVAAVALILGGGAVVQQVAGDDDTKPAPSKVVEPLPAPDGMRYVAMKRVAVAVPESWSTQETRCGQPLADTVYFTESSHRNCLVKPIEPISTLHFVDRNSDEGRELAALAMVPTSRNGVPVVEGQPCGGVTGRCDTPVPFIADTGDQGVVLVLSGPAAEPPQRDQIMDTLQLLPDDLVAVPRIEPGTRISKADQKLEAVGLQLPPMVGLLVDFRTFGTDPPAGSVVRFGSEVAVLPAPPASPLMDDFTIAAAVRIVQSYVDDNPEAVVESAWARSTKGSVAQPNVGECTSGELLRISMFGTFPNVTTSGPPGSLDGTPSSDPDPLAGVVTEVRLTADAQTEEVCLLSVTTGTTQPDSRDTQVYGAEDETD